MNDEQLQAIKARANAATPGPWECHNDDFVVVLHDGVWHTISIPDTSPNAAFIAAARADVPALVAEVERLRAQLAAARIASQEVYKALAAICPECGGSGEVDSGGFTPWGVGINETCPVCKGSGKAYNDGGAK